MCYCTVNLVIMPGERGAERKAPRLHARHERCVCSPSPSPSEELRQNLTHFGLMSRTAPNVSHCATATPNESAACYRGTLRRRVRRVRTAAASVLRVPKTAARHAHAHPGRKGALIMMTTIMATMMEATLVPWRLVATAIETRQKAG